MSEYAPGPERRLTPTDVAQYLRQGRCERFLRLRLVERTVDPSRRFLKDLGVSGQEPPQVVTRAGAAFERGVLERLAEQFPLLDLSAPGRAVPDTDALLSLLRDVEPGGALAVAQARLEGRIGDCAVQGIPDLLLWRRADDGAPTLWIVDIKASERPRVEHRLQVAFYDQMLAPLLGAAGIVPEGLRWGILYRGPAGGIEAAPEERRADLERDAAAARETLGLDGVFLEGTVDPDAYRDEARTLVAHDDSAAARIARAPFRDLSFHLGPHCDDCLYNEFCMLRVHRDRDLSLVPTLAAAEKRALQGAGVGTIDALARLKDVDPETRTLRPAAQDGAAETVARLAGTPVGVRLDELVLRARNARAVRDPSLPTLGVFPGSGHSSLPRVAADHHPNLVLVCADIQTDPAAGRAWMLGALVVAHAAGEPVRRRHIVRCADAPPDRPEREADLFATWIRDLMRALVELAEPDADGGRTAPIHLVFWNEPGQRQLLDALARNLGAMVGAAPALYDLLTQVAAYDSPTVTFLADEVRRRRNLPALCASLASIAALLGHSWDPDLRRRFFDRHFDVGGDDDGVRYERRSRHGSRIPVEYAYGAWDALEPAPDSGRDPLRAYRQTTRADLEALARARLDAIAHVAGRLDANPLATKTPFVLPDLSAFDDVAPHLARALAEFLAVERHTFLGAWKEGRLAPPERRTLLGGTLVVSYREADQEPAVAAQNVENTRRKRLRDQFREAWKADNPDKKRVTLSADQKADSEWSMEGLRFRLRVETEGVDADLETLLGLCGFKEGERLTVTRRWETDSRLPEAERVPFTPTPKQILYGMRVHLEALEVHRGADGRATEAFAIVTVPQPFAPGPPYGFRGDLEPFENELRYVLDPDPNDFFGSWLAKTVDALGEAETDGEPERHPLYRRVSRRDLSPVEWPGEACDAQERFLAGLDAARDVGLLHDFESGKRAFIGAHGDAPILLVQGPPGTGKSHTTAFSVWARMQGALVAGMPLRVFLCCKTHAATDVLLRGVVDAQERLRTWRDHHPALFDTFFDRRLCEVAAMRIAGKSAPPEGVTPIPKDRDREKGAPTAAERIGAHEHLVVAATPGGIYSMVKDRWPKALLGHGLCELLVLDEASQMGLPEAMTAALPLSRDGRLIVVGDPRQMPPIVQHDWENEPRRTFQNFRAYASLFDAMSALDPPFLQFSESFRLHAAMAAFLREAVYRHDGIDYHSRRTDTLPKVALPDPLAAAVLAPDYPLVVVVHDEISSQDRNTFEAALLGPVLRALCDPSALALEAREGFGVVVPHRAQRAALRLAYPELRVWDPATGEVQVEAVDTVERYQGDERRVMVFSATESDPEYLAASAGFLLDPRRLTVALSRAKQKLVVVASRSLFDFSTTDDTLFAHAQLWKSLLRRACPETLWEGVRDGHAVTVRGGR